MRRDANRRFAIRTRVGSERKSCRLPSEINLLRFQCSLYVYSLGRMRVDRHKFIIFIESLHGKTRLTYLCLPVYNDIFPSCLGHGTPLLYNGPSSKGRGVRAIKVANICKRKLVNRPIQHGGIRAKPNLAPAKGKTSSLSHNRPKLFKPSVRFKGPRGTSGGTVGRLCARTLLCRAHLGARSTVSRQARCLLLVDRCAGPYHRRPRCVHARIPPHSLYMYHSKKALLGSGTNVAR